MNLFSRVLRPLDIFCVYCLLHGLQDCVLTNLIRVSMNDTIYDQLANEVVAIY